MQDQHLINMGSKARNVITTLFFLSIFFVQSCIREDPKPVNDQEVITTVTVTLAPDGGGDAVTLKFFDADGELGDIEPMITVSGAITASTTYVASIELLNETVSPVEAISAEIAVEAHDHLFCFDVTGSISISYEDEDKNGLPLGLITTWETGAAGEAAVTITLRHQQGTKTGACPGSGDTDVQITFPVTVQ